MRASPPQEAPLGGAPTTSPSLNGAGLTGQSLAFHRRACTRIRTHRCRRPTTISSSDAAHQAARRQRAAVAASHSSSKRQSSAVEGSSSKQRPAQEQAAAGCRGGRERGNAGTGACANARPGARLGATRSGCRRAARSRGAGMGRRPCARTQSVRHGGQAREDDDMATDRARKRGVWREELTTGRMAFSGRPGTGRRGDGDGEMRRSEEEEEDSVGYVAPHTDEAS